MWKEWRSSSEIYHLLIFFPYCYLISYLKWSLKSFLQCYGSYIIFHLPTQSQWGESSGVLFGCFMSLMCAAHLLAPWHVASHSAKGRLNGLAKLKRPTCSVRGVHPPTPWVQVDSVLMNGWLPCAADGHNVQTTCCFLNGDHTVTL